jgi:hypothetical protein
MLLLQRQDRALDLIGQLVGVPVRPTRSILEGFEAALLESIEKLMTCDPRDAELAAERGHLFAFEESGYESETFIHRFTLIPRHLGAPQMQQCVNHVSGILCKLSLAKHNVARRSRSSFFLDMLDTASTF